MQYDKISRFTDLREEIKLECNLKNEAISNIIQKIARFKYEDGKNIPLAKVLLEATSIYVL